MSHYSVLIANGHAAHTGRSNGSPWEVAAQLSDWLDWLLTRRDASTGTLLVGLWAAADDKRGDVRAHITGFVRDKNRESEQRARRDRDSGKSVPKLGTSVLGLTYDPVTFIRFNLETVGGLNNAAIIRTESGTEAKR